MGADTNMLEVKKILQCLVADGYEFTGTQETHHSSHDAIADFSKILEYSETDGNLVSDGKITVSIQFEKQADYENFEKNEHGDNEYIGDITEFIEKLIEEIKRHLVQNVGGKKRSKNRGKNRGKNRKTQKKRKIV
jgi:hypothetical protein